MMWLLIEVLIVGWILKCTALYSLLRFSQMLQNKQDVFFAAFGFWPKISSTCSLGAFSKKWGILQRQSLSPDPNLIEHAFQLLKTNLEGERTSSKGQAEHLKGGNATFLQSQTVNDFNPSMKNQILTDRFFSLSLTKKPPNPILTKTKHMDLIVYFIMRTDPFR